VNEKKIKVDAAFCGWGVVHSGKLKVPNTVRIVTTSEGLSTPPEYSFGNASQPLKFV
jgi:hypothetical protein